MKLNKYKKPNEIKLSGLIQGDCFELNNKIYILTDSSEMGTYTCVLLSDGSVSYKRGDVYVTPVTVEATVSY